MNVITIVKVLFGGRQAIHDVANSRHAAWLGLLFVLSAGFAREYDGEDLLHEPWHLLIPVVASLGTSFLLYGLLRLMDQSKEKREGPYFRGYRIFLSLYWMTAPLAWLYAIPVERLFSAEEATRWNLKLLGIVALWRVVLMTRIVAVLFEKPFWAALLPVMLFADTVAVVVLYLTPLPIISIMGGIRLTESESLIQLITVGFMFLGIVTWPIWLLTTTVINRSKKFVWRIVSDPERHNSVGVSAWILAAAALLIWIPILPGPQREQQLRRDVESELRNGRIREALATMSNHEQSDFPPHWDPPPRIGYGQWKPELLDVLEVAQSTDTKRWVLSLFEQKLIQVSGVPSARRRKWEQMQNDEFDRNLAIFEKLPQDSPVLEEHREVFRLRLRRERDPNSERNKRIRRLFGFKDTEYGHDVSWH